MKYSRFKYIAYYDDLQEGANQLQLQLSECSIADFDTAATNTYSCNRIYAVQSVSGHLSTVEIVKTGDVFDMTPGKVLFFGAGTRIKFDFRKGTRFFAFHFNLQLRTLQEVFLAKDLYGERNDPQFVNALIELYDSEGNLLPAVCRLKALLFDQVAHFIPPDLQVLQQDVLIRYAPVLEYINSHLSARLSVEEIADAVKIPRDTLSRNFSRDMGLTLKKYISRLLCGSAEQLLRDRALKINEIAEKLQFNDEYYFSHFFRRESGISPSSFRRKVLHL